MKIAIFSDVHANLEALQAVISDAVKQGCLAVYCLGDVVGYGPNPNECCQLLRDAGITCIKGNHDELATMQAPLPEGLLNLLAFQSLTWTRKQLSPVNSQWLSTLPYVKELPEIGIALAHATFNSPDAYEYVCSEHAAGCSFKAQPQRIGFIGHTHEARLFVRDGATKRIVSSPLREFMLLSGTAYCLINVGSIGQPLDRDSRSSYVVWDTETQELWSKRVPLLPRFNPAED